MNIEIKTLVLNALLNKVSKALSSNANNESLSGIKFEANDNTLTLIASNNVFLIECKTDLVNVIKPGKCLILGKLINDLAKKTIETDISIVDEVNTVMFSTKNTKFKLKKLDINLYPKRKQNNCTIDVDFKTDDFIYVVKKTIISTATNSDKRVFNGINFKHINNALLITATDSFRLSRVVISNDQQYNFNIIIPNVALNELLKILDDKSLKMKLSNNYALFITKDMELETRLIDGPYPNCDSLIPNSFTSEITVQKLKLLNAIDRLSTILSLNNQSLIKMFINKNLTIETLNGDYGQAKEVIDLENNGLSSDLNIAISTKYISDALKTFDDDIVTLNFSGTTKPIIINSCKNNEMIQLILPIRVDW